MSHHGEQDPDSEDMTAALARLTAIPTADPARLAQEDSAGDPTRAWPPQCRSAGVLCALIPCTTRGQLCVLLTQRAAHLSRHAGEVCLPGGGVDEEDASVADAALREAREEVGLVDAAVLTTLQPHVARYGALVYPTVAQLPPDDADAVVATLAARAHAGEVAHVFTAPLTAFLSANGHAAWDLEWLGQRCRFHAFTVYHAGREYTVWGLTAAILIELAFLAYAREPDFEWRAPGQPRMPVLAREWARGKVLADVQPRAYTAIPDQVQPFFAKRRPSRNKL